MIKPRYIAFVLSLLITAAAGCGGEVSPTVEATPGLDGERINNFYTNEEIAYLLEIALWRDTSLQAPMIRRWKNGILIGTKGSPTPEDLATLQQVATELDGLVREISITVDISDTATPNLTLYFIPRGAFGFIQPDYTYPDFSFAALPRDSIIHTSTVLVATDSTSQRQRDGLIYRGLAAGLGLSNLSASHPGSIFYNGAQQIPEPHFSHIDRTIIELLYSSAILGGMKREDVIRLLANRA